MQHRPKRSRMYFSSPRCIPHSPPISFAYIFNLNTTWWPTPVAARSKAWVWGHSLAGNAGSNPAGTMDVCFECCVLSDGGLCDELITCQFLHIRKFNLLLFLANLQCIRKIYAPLSSCYHFSCILLTRN
jgi:hypothetical protein